MWQIFQRKCDISNRSEDKRPLGNDDDIWGPLSTTFKAITPRSQPRFYSKQGFSHNFNKIGNRQGEAELRQDDN